MGWGGLGGLPGIGPPVGGEAIGQAIEEARRAAEKGGSVTSVRQAPPELILHFLKYSKSPASAGESYRAVEEDVKMMRQRWKAQQECEQRSSTISNASDPDFVGEDAFPHFEADPDRPAELEVVVGSCSKLGVIVESVFERTVVREVSPGSAAEMAGVEPDTLLVGIGGQSTHNLCHYETVELLQRAQRPVVLRLRYISRPRLERRREEMRALIQCSVGPSTPPLRPQPHIPSQMLPELGEMADAGGGDGWWAPVDTFPPMSTDESDSIWEAASGMAARQCRSISSASSSGTTGMGLLEAAEGSIFSILRLLCVGEAMEDARLPPPPPSSESEPATGAASPAERVRGKYLTVLEEFVGVSAPVLDTSEAISAAAAFPSPDWIRRGSPQQHLRRTIRRLGDVATAWEDETLLTVREEIRELLCTVLEATTVDPGIADLAEVGGANGAAPAAAPRYSPAIEVLRDLVVHLPQAQLETQIPPLVHRLGLSTSLSARVACCVLLCPVYGRLPLPEQLILRGALTRLFSDPVLAVRVEAMRAAYSLSSIIDGSAVPWLLMLCEQLSRDEDSSLRRMAIPLCLHYSRELPRVLLQYHGGGQELNGPLNASSFAAASALHGETHLIHCKVMPVLSRLAEDSDWMVRASLLEYLGGFCQAFGAHWGENVFLDLAYGLAEDPAIKVREACAGSLVPLFQAMLWHDAEAASVREQGDEKHGQDAEVSVATVPNGDMMPHLLDTASSTIVKLAGDPVASVRASLAHCIAEMLRLMASVSSEDLSDCMETTFIPLIQHLLRDPNPMVTKSMLHGLTYAATLPSVNTEPPPRCLLSPHHAKIILPDVRQCGSNRQWRVRLAAVETVPMLAACTVDPVLCKEVSELCGVFLLDPVDSVRTRAAEVICSAAPAFASSSGLGARQSAQQSSPDEEAEGSVRLCMCRNAPCAGVPNGPQVHGGDCEGHGCSEVWLYKVVLPQLEACQSCDVHKGRIVALHMVRSLIQRETLSVDHEKMLLGIIVPALERAAKDPTANVRLTAARTAECFPDSQHMQNSVVAARIEQCLRSILVDQETDSDVIFYTKRALEKFAANFES